METMAYVLDYLPQGRAADRSFHREPVVLGLGETELKFLEILVRPGVEFAIGGRIPLVVLEGRAPPIDHVRRRLSHDELTATARAELPHAIEEIVRAHAERYLRFFNESQAVSRRFHPLELLPGIGKRTMQAIITERTRAPFTSFADLEQRVPLATPERAVALRIEQELTGVEDKYRLFVAP